ncbi:hypothetical protein GTG28_00695 [Vibrio sp. OCN044]|uniref:Uncharacterized protein n=1 Tax=Vibrio tetraodonis subsp. pristinus TaxID=2695891 RepID=A0A6L8LSZ0_9VIBR|nr:hypothetical protein [Vibrio tetraodonis]MYM57750.1 hypothetical protein [Vibrio tetraodonis subsp. pristinus]
MKPIYLYDAGIKPWEQTTTVSDSRFATITVVHRSINELFGLWHTLATTIRLRLPRVLKWRTVGHSIEGSKIQELKLVKQLKSEFSDDDHLEKNGDSNIYSYVMQLSVLMGDFDLNTITQPRYTALLFLPDGEPNNGSLWETFKNSDDGLEAGGMESSLRSYEDMLICRLFESDTHVSLQLVGLAEQVDFLLNKLNEIDIERVDEKDVAKLINS